MKGRKAKGETGTEIDHFFFFFSVESGLIYPQLSKSLGSCGG